MLQSIIPPERLAIYVAIRSQLAGWGEKGTKLIVLLQSKIVGNQQLRPDSVEAAYERKGWTDQHPQYDPLFDGQMFASNPLLLEITHCNFKQPRTVDGHEQFTLTMARDSKYEQLFEAISIPIRQISCGNWVEFSGGITGRWKLAQKEEQHDGFDYMACENHELWIWIQNRPRIDFGSESVQNRVPPREEEQTRIDFQNRY
ncbi:hypothetical protein C8R43DRAFT_945373 [Mycena crocata]|nr:hypothetical protein C8R43DRAFT_945373 [Mycena crocata]